MEVGLTTVRHVGKKRNTNTILRSVMRALNRGWMDGWGVGVVCLSICLVRFFCAPHLFWFVSRRVRVSESLARDWSDV